MCIRDRDVAGAALATSIAMFISWLVSIVYIRKMFPEIHFTFLPRRFSGKMMKDILAIGLPVGLNNSLYSLGHVALQTFNNSQGAIFMAGGAVAGRITGCSNIDVYKRQLQGRVRFPTGGTARERKA